MEESLHGAAVGGRQGAAPGDLRLDVVVLRGNTRGGNAAPMNRGLIFFIVLSKGISETFLLTSQEYNSNLLQCS